VTHTVELVRPEPPFEQGDFFDRGERAIVVDGKRWGRTIVKGHGVWGNSHHFKQDADDMILKDGCKDEPWKEHYWERVDSDRNRRYRRDDNPVRDTFELVIEKVQALIAAGKLRDPDVVRSEQQKRNAAWLEKRKAEKAEQAAQFRAKALEAAGYLAEPNDPQSLELVERIVAAMNWAAAQ
jgi:hypothetical protein